MKIPDGQLESLALCIASGSMSIRAWAKKNDVPNRSAYRWARHPWTVARVQVFRDDQRGRNASLLARNSGIAMKALGRIVAPGSKSKDADVIAAARVLMGADQGDSAIADHAARLAALESRKRGKRP